MTLTTKQKQQWEFEMQVKIESEDHWHKMRYGVVGSSDIACLFGLSSFKSKFTLWHEKAGNFKQELSSARIDSGNYLEDAIGRMAGDKLSTILGNGKIDTKGNNFYYSPSMRLGATPDAVFTLSDTGEKLVVEIKNMDFIQYKEKCPDDVPMDQYRLQLQHQMHCMNLKKGVLAIFVGGNDLKLFFYDYSPLLGSEMEKSAAKFWQSIKDRESPTIDDPKDLEVAKVVFRSKNRHIDLSFDNEAVAICHDLHDATEKRKHYEKIEKLSKAKLIEKMNGYNTASIRESFNIRITETKGNDGTIITQDMVGQTINRRKGIIKVTLKDIKI